MPQRPSWLVEEPYIDVDLGAVRSGKEAQIDLVERRGEDGSVALLARKRYLPRQVTQKGQLAAMGLQRASTFRHDVRYREGRQFRKSRDRRAVERMSTYGKRLLQDRWTGHEHDVMTRLWAAGVTVPYPVAFGDDVFELEFVGHRDGAAPQLVAAGGRHRREPDGARLPPSRRRQRLDVVRTTRAASRRRGAVRRPPDVPLTGPPLGD